MTIDKPLTVKALHAALGEMLDEHADKQVIVWTPGRRIEATGTPFVHRTEGTVMIEGDLLWDDSKGWP